MKTRLLWASSGVILISAALGACSKATPANEASLAQDISVVKSESAAPRDTSPAVVDAESSPATPGEPPPPPTPQPPTGTPTTTTALLLAYSYSATLALPADNVSKVMKAHEAKCIAAGPAICQVVTAASQKEGDSIVANLSVRAIPSWLTTFRAGLEQDAKGADGKVDAQGVTSEDLTRNITDSEARLRALTILRTRIEALIADRPGKLSDVLEAERELARVQGDIDSFESNLSVMRARVSMSTMDLTYQSRQIAVGGATVKPLGDAITGFFGVMAGSLAILLTFLAAILPFALVLGPVAYFGLKWQAKRKAKVQAGQQVQM